MSRRRGQRGQAVVEFALIVPIIVLVLVSVAELGLAFGNANTIGYGSREGARVGSALATGQASDCSSGNDPSGVDEAVITAVQRILKSPGSGVEIGKVEEVRIFKATASGAETAGTASVWQYTGEASGPQVDPGPGVSNIDFSPPQSNPWPACTRDNSSDDPDSIGVTVIYRFAFFTPLPRAIEAISGGDLSIILSETTVMALNPTI